MCFDIKAIMTISDDKIQTVAMHILHHPQSNQDLLAAVRLTYVHDGNDIVMLGFRQVAVSELLSADAHWIA